MDKKDSEMYLSYVIKMEKIKIMLHKEMLNQNFQNLELISIMVKSIK